MRRLVFGIVSAMSLGACTAITVDPLEPSEDMRFVCIQENPRVEVSDFVHVVRDGLERHGVRSEVFRGNAPDDCEYIMTYTALRSWDFTPYLSHAELRIEREGRRVAYGEYHLRGKGGLALNKWADTRAKMDPVIDEMLGQMR